MFKSARWRSDKSKIKAVFKLQFHATQLAAVGGDSLTIAVIPNDVGKPTARLEKTKVKDGSCHWEKPHFETVKFTQDQKTGKINEKLYRFVVATGSSVFGIVGEVSLDFSKYSEATKLSSLSLPLKYARSTSVLHISIQRVQDQREVNESDIVNEDNNSLTVHSSNGDIEGSLQNDSVEDHAVLTDNNVRDHAASSVSDITLSGSDSSSGLDTPRQPEPTDTKPAHEASKPPIYEGHHKSSQWDWLDGSVHELSTDDSSMLSPRETLSREISDEGSGSPDDVIKKLKGELVILARQAEVSEMEIQTLRKQIVKESKRSQDLSKEVVALKEERNELKEECEKMKVKVKVKSSLSTEGGDPWALADELRQELNYEKDLNSNLRLQLQKTQESNAELILAVRDLDEMLESKSKCATAPKLQEVNAKSDTDDEDQKALEDIVREHSGMKDAYIQEQKIIDLYNEIELYKRDKDELEMQMEQIALDYEILKQENHDLSYKLEQSQIQEQLKMQYECSTSYADVNELESQIENLHNELKLKSKELSESTLAVKELETQIKNLEEQFGTQADGFEADMEDLIRAKVEQEQRAIHAEENIRKVKLQNAHTAGKLQEEFRKLSIEMASAFRENENAAMKAIDEASRLRVEKKHLEETIKKVKKEFDHLGSQYEDKLADLTSEITLKSKQLGEMEKQIENLSHELTHQKTSYNAMIEDLDGEINDRETEIRLVKVDLESLENELRDLKNAKNDKDNEVERLQSEIERLKSRCNDMKQFCKENESEKENLKKQVSQLKGDLKKKDEAISSIEKRLKEGSKPPPRNNKTVPVSRSPKEVNNMKEKVKQLEGQINLKEIALERAEASFLEKEKDLKHRIEDLERRLEVLDQNIKNPQASTAQNRNDAEIKKAGDQEIFELLNKNKCMEVELKEMQERYSEISLKFAEVEGERQQLVMTLRNLKNSKLMVQT
ncbi:putative NT-type C2 domain-containing protein [Helianthus annuus]|uniref:NT-type C2 domain-containing protein n=1 Tax=Helianthus annuus TaxID=4232 RepID=A0A251UEZ0_HELAN|nr:nucleoporin nup211 [Helianthus annuus]KAF5800773.1 putative NT-type C2 domain-containing protein [Helianthus annuus]KAJ0559157.1 putative NT-type C2 domain-containing protein [Helianthus annuus]KAJ0565068.1 putative NT-type C2 domain-containing protein [Helianthus annuus]KAJ0572098.1 putative NT-type C2 domain-containing protein [Helianthus annuus]KAJ0739506.1 putative NT-type C2 domain-containing protein [Helianthus annuus]